MEPILMRTPTLLPASLIVAISVFGLAAAATGPANATDEVRQMNAISVIYPYKHHGTWLFDDERVGLVRELFVAGADTVIDRMAADIPGAERGFTLLFSATPFPVTTPGSSGGGRSMEDTGTTALSWIWKAGCARHSSSTSTKPLRTPLPLAACRLAHRR
jgi:hypothetical protein